MTHGSLLQFIKNAHAQAQGPFDSCRNLGSKGFPFTFMAKCLLCTWPGEPGKRCQSTPGLFPQPVPPVAEPPGASLRGQAQGIPRCGRHSCAAEAPAFCQVHRGSQNCPLISGPAPLHEGFPRTLGTPFCSPTCPTWTEGACGGSTCSLAGVSCLPFSASPDPSCLLGSPLTPEAMAGRALTFIAQLHGGGYDHGEEGEDCVVLHYGSSSAPVASYSSSPVESH